jgi:hypothetical protein
VPNAVGKILWKFSRDLDFHNKMYFMVKVSCNLPHKAYVEERGSTYTATLGGERNLLPIIYVFIVYRATPDEILHIIKIKF